MNSENSNIDETIALLLFRKVSENTVGLAIPFATDLITL